MRTIQNIGKIICSFALMRVRFDVEEFLQVQRSPHNHKICIDIFIIIHLFILTMHFKGKIHENTVRALLITTVMLLRDVLF